MNRKVDLHLHTIASDGSWTPREAVLAAKKAGLGIMAVTDHDSLGSVAPVMKLAPKEGIEVIAGVEMCSTYEGRCFHILGYGFDCSNPILLAHLAHNCRLLEETDERAIGILSEEGWPVSIKEYRAYVYDPRRGGFKALFYLIDKGLCRDVKDFFSRIFIKKRGLDFPVFPSIEETVATLHKAGGVALLAHAASHFHGPGLARTLEAVGEKPLDGFECYHPAHSKEDTKTLLAYCQQHISSSAAAATVTAVLLTGASSVIRISMNRKSASSKEERTYGKIIRADMARLLWSAFFFSTVKKRGEQHDKS